MTLTLNHYFEPKKQLPLKTAIKKMRSKWDKGLVNRFDEKLSRVLDCSLSEAQSVREEWEDLGFVYYNEQGLLVLRPRG